MKKMEFAKLDELSYRANEAFKHFVPTYNLAETILR